MQLRRRDQVDDQFAAFARDDVAALGVAVVRIANAHLPAAVASACVDRDQALARLQRCERQALERRCRLFGHKSTQGDGVSREQCVLESVKGREHGYRVVGATAGKSQQSGRADGNGSSRAHATGIDQNEAGS